MHFEIFCKKLQDIEFFFLLNTRYRVDIDRKSQETDTFVLRKLTTNTRAVLLLGALENPNLCYARN